MQEQAALLPGSQAGEEGTTVWSHGAHRFPLTSTPPTLPLSILHTSLSLPFSFSSLILYLSYVIEFFFTSLTFVFLCLPHRPTQIHTVEIKDDYLLQEKAHTQTNTLRFLTGGRMFPRSKDIFTCHWHGLTAKNTASIFTSCVYLLVWKKDVEVVFKRTAMGNVE